MSSASTNQSPYGQTEASSSHASNGKQPAVEDDSSDEEALLADDPLERDLPEQSVPRDACTPDASNTGLVGSHSSASPNPLPPLLASLAFFPRIRAPSKSATEMRIPTIRPTLSSTTSIPLAAPAMACKTPRMRRQQTGTSKGPDAGSATTISPPLTGSSSTPRSDSVCDTCIRAQVACWAR